MIANLAAGSALVLITIGIHAVGLSMLTGLLRWTIGRFSLHRHRPGAIVIMAATVAGLFVIHSAEIWAWAFGFLAVGAISGLERALFFSTLSFSTLGAEGVSLSPEWGLFGAIEGVAGFLLIGWSTAYLIPTWTRHGPLKPDD